MALKSTSEKVGVIMWYAYNIITFIHRLSTVDSKHQITISLAGLVLSFIAHITVTHTVFIKECDKRTNSKEQNKKQKVYCIWVRKNLNEFK